MCKREKGIVLVAVIAFAVIFAIVGIALLAVAEQEVVQTRIEHQKAEAFYFAEAGLAKMSEILQTPIEGNLNEVLEGSLDQGSYLVEIDTNQTPCYVISTGTSGTIQKRVRVKATFLAPPFENAVFAMNNSGITWQFQLRGTGNPVTSTGTNQWGQPCLLSIGGKDIINGNLFIDGDIFLYQQSQVNPAPAPNIWSLNGDAEATGNISVLGSASVSGATNPDQEEPAPVDLAAMDYANNNTYNVAQIFQGAGITSGYLPSGNALRDVFVKNPSNGTRDAACDSTTVDDYFFEPTSGFVDGTPFTGATPLHMGNNSVYYVDGDLWIHSDNTKGFLIDGKATIVATGNIHICDNLQYKDVYSALGLVALGKYNGSGNLTSGGNIYFGDPANGTMGFVSAMMFAANNFLYNTDPQGKAEGEPKTGFIIDGCFAAMNEISVIRDWYTKVSGKKSTPKPAIYDPITGKWFDAKTGTNLSPTEISSMRHYQMIINYDDRVRTQTTRPPGLPIGNGTKIFAGFSNWEEL
jgi:hypothetical protein